MVIRFHGGSALAGILIGFRENALRLAVAGLEDLVELRWKDGFWVGADGFPVETDFDPSPLAFERGRIEAGARERAITAVPHAGCKASSKTASPFAPYVN